MLTCVLRGFYHSFKPTTQVSCFDWHVRQLFTHISTLKGKRLGPSNPSGEGSSHPHPPLPHPGMGVTNLHNGDSNTLIGQPFLGMNIHRALFQVSLAVNKTPWLK